MSTALAVIEAKPAAELFKPGAIDPILDAIRAEVRREAACLDISTEANRKAIASLAFKVAKSKTFVDKQRKDLVAEEKIRLKRIDDEGRRIWNELEALQIEVRKPLTDWEEADKTRIAAHEAELQELINAGTASLARWQELSVDAMRDRLREIHESKYDWQEFHQRAVAAVVKTIGQIKEAIAKREKYDAEQAELAALREANLVREQEEREAAIARKAKEEAEAVARKREEERVRAAEAERQRIEAERAQAEARAKQADAQRVAAEEKARKDAEDAAERLRAQEARAKAAAEEAERDKQLFAERAERDRIAAENAAKERERKAQEKAEADRRAAVEAERQRAEDEKRREREAEAKREANRKHVAKINAEVCAALVQQEPITQYLAEVIVKVIASGKIPHTKISY